MSGRYGSISPRRTESVPDDAGSVVPRVLAPGTLFAGRYVLEDVIGIGGYAVVYAAQDRHLATRVAIKVLRMDRISESAVRRFRREVLIARGAQSPHLLRLYDIGDADGTLYITMELVDGVSLREETRNGTLSIERAVEVARDVARALSALHALGIVHHDVKPENILVARDGSIKLADFGLARFISEERMTRTGSVVGTFEYVSPEQALGRETGPASDLYSLGVVLFELLTDRLPYSTRTSLGALLAHVQQRPKDVRHLRPDVPRWLARIVSRLLQKEARDRYASAAAVERDLGRRASGFVWPRPARAGLAAVATLGVLSLLAGAGWSWKAWNDSRFDSFVADTDGVRAVDRAGRTLWQMSNVWPSGALTARVLPEGRRVGIAFQQTPGGADRNFAWVLDLQTGQRLRQIEFPSRGMYFPSFSSTFFCSSAIATDIDGDGWDEVVAAFAHNPYWPSYAMVYDGRTGDITNVLVASGRHDPVGTMDIDADGRRELIFAGPSNKNGWYTGLAAVRVSLTSDRMRGFDTTPDRVPIAGQMEELGWYALLPSGGWDISRIKLDEQHRRISVLYPDGHTITIGADGFLLDAPPRPAGLRQQARREAYAALREATRALDGGMAGVAVLRCEDARRLADRAGDAILGQWAERVRIRSLIAAERFDEAAGALRAFRASPPDSANAAWDAARAYHLAGRTAEAVQWYRAGYARGDQYGRLKWEFLVGIVLALSERERWDEAAAEIERFATALPNEIEAQWCRRYVQWRRTGKPDRIPALQSYTDLHRYWDIEFRLAAGESSDALARTIEQAIRSTSEVAPLLLSAKSELFARRGFDEQARALAAEAVRNAEAVAAHDPIMRAHLPVLRSRVRQHL